jgi:methylmalonyl-CoA/ethylmalonyl-CoA epimerase
MGEIIKINHVAIVVENIEEALAFWRDALGLPLDHLEDVPSQQSKVAFLPVGDNEVELVTPTNDDSGIGKYLQSKGPGMHHLCFEVSNIEEILFSLKGKGVRLINETPQELPGRKMAFIHPKSTGGVLVELYELTN